MTTGIPGIADLAKSLNWPFTIPREDKQMWRSAYHRVSDDSVSSFGGHMNRQDAIDECLLNLKADDIDRVWVRDPNDKVVWKADKWIL